MIPDQQVPVLETCKLMKEKGWQKETYFKYMQVGGGYALDRNLNNQIAALVLYLHV